MFWGSGKRRKEVKEIVKRILRVLMAALITAAMMVVMAAPAFADPPEREKPGKGHPVVNEGGNCPGGLNKDTSPGGLKKCD